MQEEEKEIGQVNDVTIGDEESVDIAAESATLEVNNTPETQELNTEVLDILPSTEVEGDDR